MTDLTFDMINRRWPRATHDLTQAMAANAAKDFADFGLTTDIEKTDLLAQISEETGAGTEVSENLNYSAVRLMQVWPSRFPTLASAEPFAHNPKALADAVYGSRGGNRPGTDDGWTFRGRGAMETTFHDNYAMTARLTGLDCVNNPDLVSSPVNFLRCACAFWKNANLNPVATAQDFRLETLRLNGGYINLATRLQWRTIWRQEFGVGVAPTVGLSAPLPASVVGSTAWVQQRLNDLGLKPALDVDGVFGGDTADAVATFQTSRGLPVTKQMDAATLAALRV